MSLPRILIVALGRINASDNSSNGLLLRNLFGLWPASSLAQIYSSGNNNDHGYFGSYYQLSPKDRRYGHIFYSSKDFVIESTGSQNVSVNKSKSLKSRVTELVLNSGFYELIFRPTLSKNMLTWVESFKPEAIFAQGYNLTFTWLPLMLAREFNLPIIYYPSDDWPTSLYATGTGPISVLKHIVRPVVEKSTQSLVSASSVPIAFNNSMSKEYETRYGKQFHVLMHGDYPERFRNAAEDVSKASTTYTIVTTGTFYSRRIPLLFDLDKACEIVCNRGLPVRAKVFSVNRIDNLVDIGGFRHIEFYACPPHQELASELCSATVLFLPERFDETSELIRLSVSSKAHLFMFSKVPIIVYSDLRTGLAEYARRDKWALLISERNPNRLAEAIVSLLTNFSLRAQLIEAATTVACKNHHLPEIQVKFSELVTKAVYSNVNSG